MIINVLALLFVSFSWGIAFVLIKYTEASIPPLTLMAERGTWGFLALLILCFVLKLDLKGHAQHWLSFLRFAILGIAFTWIMVALGQEDVSSGVASVLVSITPLVTFIISVFIIKEESLSVTKTLGLLLGVLGLVLVIGLSNIVDGGTTLKGVLLISAGFIVFAINSVLVRKTAAKTDPIVSTTYFVGMATVVMWIIALIFENPLHTDLTEIDIVLELILGVFCFSIAFIVYYWLVKKSGVFFSSLTFYLVPIMGAVGSYFILGEKMDLTQLIGIIVVLFGVYLINKEKFKSTKS